MRTSDFLGEIRGNERQDTGSAHAATRDTLIHFPDVNMREIEARVSRLLLRESLFLSRLIHAAAIFNESHDKSDVHITRMMKGKVISMIFIAQIQK